LGCRRAIGEKFTLKYLKMLEILGVFRKDSNIGVKELEWMSKN